MSGSGGLTRRQEAAILALLSEPTHARAAGRAGVSEPTLRRWLRLPPFREAYLRVRRDLVEGAVGRIQAATGQAVDTLVAVAREGAKDSDRVRAAVALLGHAFNGLTEADALRGCVEGTDQSAMVTGDVVKLLSARLRQVDQSELPTGEKSRLTASLADGLLRAIGVDVLDKRLEALQAVLLGRKDKGR